MQSDRELVEACCRGDRVAANAFVLRYQVPVYTLALRMLGDASEAEDAAQSVFLNALRSLGSFRGTSSLKTWVYRIAVNECSARLHMRKRFTKPPTTENDAGDAVAELPDGHRSVLDELDGAEQENRTRRAVFALPETYRLPIILRYFDDLSYEETAGVLGVSVDVVKVRLFRAKAMLRSTLTGEEGDAYP